MAIDPGRLLALDIPEVRQAYDWRDCALYALGIGCGMDPLDEAALRHLDERAITAVPAMANVLGYPGPWIRDLDTGIDWSKVVYGEQAMRLHRPLPPAGEVIGRSRVVDLIDKGEGRGALVLVERTITDARTGEALATLLQTIFCRGDGGFGGKRERPAGMPPVPDRAPDDSLALPTPPNLALIYRLSGDLNPLHSDPAVARRAGFERPILHGLATFGIACRALMRMACGDDPERVRAQAARFSQPVYPGDTITVDLWRLGPGRAAYQARVEARDARVLSNGTFEYD